MAKTTSAKSDVVSRNGSASDRMPAPARCVSRAITSKSVVSRDSRSTAGVINHVAGGENRNQLAKPRTVCGSASNLLTEHLSPRLWRSSGNRLPIAARSPASTLRCLSGIGYVRLTTKRSVGWSCRVLHRSRGSRSDLPSSFLLGIECDGASYHSNKSARDILRQQILERLGWNIYRIWSTDWFRDPAGQTKKLTAFEDLRKRRAQSGVAHGCTFAHEYAATQRY